MNAGQNHLRMIGYKAFMLCGILLFCSLSARGQNCDCPPLTSCGACQGFIKSMTLRYHGFLLPAIVTVRDGGNNVIFGPSLIPVNGEFTVTSPSPSIPFIGNQIRISGELDILGTLLTPTIISTTCASAPNIGVEFENFTLVDGTSVAGPLCCTAADMEDVAPTITCPANVNVALTSSQCTGTGTWPVPLTSDNCGISSLVSTRSSGSQFNLGSTPVVYTVTDHYGNTASCSFNVTVTDNAAPVISNCPVDINVSLLANECSKVVSWTPPTSLSCVSLVPSIAPGSTFNRGTTPVTYTATDAAGNTSMCTFNVNVTDNTGPVINGCPSNITIGLADNECSKVVTWTPPTTMTCATISTLTPPGSTFNRGTTPVTYTATDAAGNISTCTFNVTVTDNTPPVITGCPSTITVGLAAGECSTAVAWTPPTTMTCATITSDIPPGAMFSYGTTPVTYTATDAAGNKATCTFNVVVTDNTAPAITGCPLDITVGLLANECDKVVTWTPPTTMTCATIATTIAPGSTFNRGTTPVTYTATDAAGNVSTCTFNVTVTDNMPPIISGCPSDITVGLDENECSKAVAWTPPTTMNCATIASDVAPGAMFSYGTTPVTYTATDAAGNISTCTFNVTVTDNTPPVITGCPSNILVNLGDDECSKVVTWTPPTTQTCATISSDVPSGTMFQLGTTTVTYTATDAAGNKSTCSFDVIVTDNTDPVITGCPSTITVSLATNECSKVVTWLPPTSTSCVSLVPSIASGTAFPLGTTPVTYTATDAAGNTSSCTFNVTVLDNTAPVLTGCPSDITVSLAPNECSKVVTWTPPTTMTCATIDVDIPSGATFNLGATTVTYTATDAAGNKSTCSFIVTVTDTTVPVISGCPSNITVALAANECSKVVTWTPPTTTTCVTLTSNIMPGAAFPRGVTPVTYTATDAAGNKSTCSFSITVTDNTAPVITGCPSNITVNLAADECSKIVSWTPPTTMSCANITSDILPGSAFNLGTTPVTYTAVDAAGNISTCVFNVTVTDNTGPTITGCPSDITVALAASECSAVVTWTPPTTMSCATLAWNISPGATFGLGTTPVTYTATDAAGNKSTCTFNVTVTDNTAPVITGCPSNITVSLGANECSTPVSWSPPETMTCATITTDKSPGATFGLGTTPVTYTATDAAGNKATCTFNVIVTDNVPPVISGCPSNISVSLAAHECSKTVTWLPPTTMSCATITSDIAPGATFSLGTTPITYTATDAAGNKSTCTFNVVVTDNTPPIITACPSNITVMLAANECSKTVTWIPPTTMSCATITSDIPVGAVFNLGTTPVTYTATDAAGNKSTCTFNVTVTDNTPPVITGCPSNITVGLAANECGKVVTWTPPTTLSCASITSDISPGATFSLGTTAVTYTATDAAGNKSTCTFNITVTDNTLPIISGCPSNITVDLAANECSKVVTWTPPTTMSCATISSNRPAGSTFNLGTTTVTYTATDGAGNKSTCSFTVTVRDTTVPVITGCPSNIQVSLAANECSKAVTWIAPTTMSCASITSDIASGALFSVGSTPVTYTATDAAGNKSTCTFNVIVTDNSPPIISACPANITVSLAANECSKVVTWPSPTTMSCASITSDVVPGSTFSLGTTPVTYTATDAAGNKSTCTFSVTVIDNTAPVISSCPTNIQVSLAADECSKVVTWTPPTTGSCATITSDISPGATFVLGTTSVTYIATDAAGNTSTCSFNVVVTDNVAPVITGCPSSISVSLSANECSKIVTWEPPITTSCAVISSDLAPGSTFSIGTTSVTYTAIDVAGNESTCSFNVIVTDNTPPEIIGCPSNIEVNLNETESSKIVTWTPPTSTTPCTTLTSSAQPGSTFSVGTTTVTYTAMDAAGNKSTCSFNVVVRDPILPVFSNYAPLVTMAADNTCEASVDWMPPTATDNCGIKSVISSHEPGTKFPVGITRVVYEAVDINDNRSFCQFDVSVENRTPPVITGCPADINVKANEDGQVIVKWDEPEASVNCGTVKLASSHDPGDIFEVGTTVVEYEATDDAGLITTCAFNVVVSFEELAFDVSKVITPDGNEVNDRWILGNIEKFQDNRVIIVDRWGSVIFSGTGYDNERVVWRGTNSKGELVPTGTYFYTVVVSYRDKRLEKKGFIELIR